MKDFDGNDLKIGDEVEIISNSMEAWHPSEVRLLQAGDTIKILNLTDDWTGAMITYELDRKLYSLDYQYMYSSEVRLIKNIIKSDICTCPSFELAAFGCKCEAGKLELKKEKDAQIST